MLSPFLGFTERDIVGTYVAGAAMNSGLAVVLSTSDTSPLTPNAYGNSFGTLALATCTTTNNLPEMGWVLQPVTTSGPSIFNLLSSIYDESVPVGANPAVVLSKPRAQVATDQYLATGTGHIAFDGSVALDTVCGIASGQPRVLQTGDLQRLIFKGQVVQRQIPCAIFEII